MCPDCFAGESAGDIAEREVAHTIVDNWEQYRIKFANRTEPDVDRFEYGYNV